MKIIISALFIFVSISTLASNKDFCGEIMSISNHNFSQGRLTNIMLRLDDGSVLILKDKRDVYGSIEALIVSESSYRNIDPKNVNFSNDETATYYYYTNYQLQNEYTICGTVDSYVCDGARCSSTRSFSLYISNNGLLYKRN
jgi:hypothetical protein